MHFLDQLLYYPFQNIIAFFVWLVPGHNAVWGVIGLTLVVRFLLLVPSRNAAKAQRKMQELQPLMEELKAEYGDDRQGLAAAQMELYRTNSISPFSSCLPVLIQLPILIILYRAILGGLNPSTVHLYSWMPQVAHINTRFLGLDLLQPDHTFLLPLLAAVLQFFQARMVMPKLPKQAKGGEPDTAQMVQQQSLYLFPAITLLAALRFPAGAVVYWVVSTLFGIVQQYYINKEMLKLKGVQQALKEGAQMHPENREKFEKVKEVVEKSAKNGVNVTVRKKG